MSKAKTLLLQGDEAVVEGGMAAGADFLPDIRLPLPLKLQRALQSNCRKKAVSLFKWKMR